VNQGGQQYSYVCEDPREAFITKSASHKTVAAPLMLIFRIRQGACYHCFWVQRLPISHEWMLATNWKINYPRCKGKNRSHSVDAHSKNGVVTVLLSLSPIKAANTSVMKNNDQITGELPYLQDHKSLTLH